MQIKHKVKQPMIWTGDLPVRHFSARPVDLSIEFQMDAVKMLDDLDNLWRKYELGFWKRFIPLMNKGIESIKSQVIKWDSEFDAMTNDQRKALTAKLNEMTKNFGETMKKEAQRILQESFAETMKGVDNTIAKAKVMAIVKVTWTVVTTVEKVLTPSGWVSAVMSLLKMNKDFQAAQKTYRAGWATLETKANEVQKDMLEILQGLRSADLAAGNKKTLPPIMEQLRAAANKLRTDVDTMNVYIANARKALDTQEQKIQLMEQTLHTPGGKPEKAMTAIKDWRAAQQRCRAELAIAAEAKSGAEKVQQLLAASTVGDKPALEAAAQKINGAAEKILTAKETVEKGTELVNAIESLSDALK